MVDSYMSPSRRRTASASASTSGIVSRNHPSRNTTCSSSRPNLSKFARTASSDTARSGRVWKVASASAGHPPPGGREPQEGAAAEDPPVGHAVRREHPSGQDRRAAPPDARLEDVARDSLVDRLLDERSKVVESPTPHHGQGGGRPIEPLVTVCGIERLDRHRRGRQGWILGAVARQDILELVEVPCSI